MERSRAPGAAIVDTAWLPAIMPLLVPASSSCQAPPRRIAGHESGGDLGEMSAGHPPTAFLEISSLNRRTLYEKKAATSLGV